MRTQFFNRILALLVVLFAIGVMSSYAQYFDDVYYNPKKAKKEAAEKQAKANYIADMASRNVDDYNRRGIYHSSAVDTIGNAVASAEDFPMTQQIQKFYNPTILIDNSLILDDVLNNSYGNVIIEIDNGLPVFVPYTTWLSRFPSNALYNPMYPSVWGPSWSVGLYNPWYSWYSPFAWDWTWGPNWWPSYAGPVWSGHPWCGPVWNSPVWGGGSYIPSHAMRPSGSVSSRPSAGWSSSTRPSLGSAASSHRPASFGGGNRVNSSNGNSGAINRNNHRSYNYNSSSNSSSNRTNNRNSYEQRNNSNSYSSGGNRSYRSSGAGGASRSTGGAGGHRTSGGRR